MRAHALDAAHAEVHFEFVDGVVFPFGKPAAFLDRVREGRESALRRGWIRAFDYKGAVNYGWFWHG
jgi:hypothetical protein